MKRLLLVSVATLCCIMASAQEYPVITGLGNGKFIITVNAAHQIGTNNGINLNDEKYSALATATELRIVTENCQLKPADLDKLAGSEFASLTTLDLSEAQIEGITQVDGQGSNNLTKIANSGTITTVIFPVQNGMVVPKHCFGNNGNNRIQNIVIPDYPDGSSYTISTNAFEKCHALRTASIGKGTFSLGGNPYALPTLSDENHPSMNELKNLNFWYTDQSGVGIFSDCENLYSVVLDKNTTCIKANTFKGCVKLDYIVLPDELRALGPGAFEDCESLATITIPEKMRFWGGQVFSKCNSLTDVYLLGEYIPLPVAGDWGGPINIEQTTNFNYTAGDNPTYSQADYAPYNAGSGYTIAILHYPGTETAIDNYRWHDATGYANVDQDGTSWPNQADIGRFNVAKESFDRENDIYIGWKFFLQGQQTNKTNDIIDITRFTESRWYSICYPFDVTIAQFQSAFGTRAALSEFSGITEDADGLTIKFVEPSVDRSNNSVILKKNHAYMIHPEKLATTGESLTIYNIVNQMEQKRDPAVWAKLNTLKTRKSQAENNSWDAYRAAYNDIPASVTNAAQEIARLQTLIENEEYRLRNVWTDEMVDAYNLAYNKRVWKDDIDDEDNSGGYRIRRYAHPRSNITYYFKGNYMGDPEETSSADVPLPAGCYYLGGGGNTGWPLGVYYRMQAGSKWTPFTAILEAGNDNIDPNAASYGALNFDDAQTTAIGNEVLMRIPRKASGKTYNLQGQQVGTNGLEGLGKGIYIVNGKKYVVK